MTDHYESPLAQAHRHVAEGEERVVRQTELVARLVHAGHDTKMASTLLKTFQDTLALMRADLQRLLEEDRT
jgi:hypothetical protein